MYGSSFRKYLTFPSLSNFFFLVEMNKVGGNSVLSITALREVNTANDCLEAVSNKRPPMRKIEIITNNIHSC